jgi:hypothetical protein
MKKLSGLFACLLLLTATVLNAETLTNDSVIQLHKLGLGDSVVVQKIKASTCNFDTSIDALKALKDAGISDEVIQAMLLVLTPSAPAPSPIASNAAPAVASAPADPNDPKAPHASGISLYEEVDGKPKMTQMKPSRVDELSSGGGFGVAFGGSSKTRAVLSDAHAQTQLKATELVFYFYFAKAEASLGSTDVSATSPEDFSLGAMETHVSHDQPVRRLEISKVSYPPRRRPVVPRLRRAEADCGGREAAVERGGGVVRAGGKQFEARHPPAAVHLAESFHWRTLVMPYSNFHHPYRIDAATLARAAALPGNTQLIQVPELPDNVRALLVNPVDFTHA